MRKRILSLAVIFFLLAVSIYFLIERNTSILSLQQLKILIALSALSFIYLLLKKTGSWIINMVNMIIMGFEPLLILVLLAMIPGGYDDISPFTGGIFVTWLYTPMMWRVLSGELKEKFPGIDSRSFLLVNFGVPLGIGFILHDTLIAVLYEVATFHLLTLGICIFLAIPITSLTDKSENTGTLLEQYKVKEFQGIPHMVLTAGKIISLLALFIWMLFIPPLWCESVFLRNIGISFPLSADQLRADHLWLFVRYAAVIIDVRIMFNVFYKIRFFDMSTHVLKENTGERKKATREVIEKTEKDIRKVWIIVTVSLITALSLITVSVIDIYVADREWDAGWKIYLPLVIAAFASWFYSYFKSLGLLAYLDDFGDVTISLAFGLFLFFFAVAIAVPGSFLVVLFILPVLLSLKIEVGVKTYRVALPLVVVLINFSVAYPSLLFIFFII